MFGNDHAVAFAGSQGNFQLNVYKPVMLHNVLESIAAAGRRHPLVRRALRARHRAERASASAEHLESSLMLVTALNPHIGYEKAAKIALKAHREDLSLREAALKLGHRDGGAVRRLGAAGGHDASDGGVVRPILLWIAELSC